MARRQSLQRAPTIAWFSSSSSSSFSVNILEQQQDGSNSSSNSSNNESQQQNESQKKRPTKFVNFPFEYHQEIELDIDTLTNRGWGLGRVELQLPTSDIANPQEPSSSSDDDASNDKNRTSINNRWVVMVPNVVPGEKVVVRIFRNYANYSEADLVSIVKKSPHRIDVNCQYANVCGGCQLQHIHIDAQRQWKTTAVRELLDQFGLTSKNGVSPTLGTDEIYRYRTKLTPHFNAPAKRRRGGPTTDPDSDNNKTNKHIQAIGFQKQTSRTILDIEACPIATEAVNAKYQQVRNELLSKPFPRKRGATLLFRQGNLDDPNVITDHKEYMTTTINNKDFVYQANNFFQNNYYVLPLMVDHVQHHASAAVQDDHDGSCTTRNMTHLVDCYCGSGLFAISCANKFETVVGIEINDRAIQEARNNAKINHVTNCEFHAAPSEAIFTTIQDFPRNTTSVIVDPPRKGCSPEFLQQLVAFAPQRIVYMSCDPATQARDARFLTVETDHMYEITSVQPFDLFPQTRHIECLMILEKKQARVHR